jgi:hypothetical protein
MTFTPEQQVQWLDAAKALFAGEPIEYQDRNGEWFGTDHISEDFPHRPYKTATAEHLAAIVAKCRSLIDQHYSESRAVAGWRATIAAIESIPLNCGSRPIFTAKQQELIDFIIAIWPEELLK